jgi:transcriptional regulator of heat shock response
MTIPKKKTVKKRKTVKELEEELEKVKSSAASQACRISQEKLAKEHFIKEIEKKDARTKELQQEIKSIKGLLAARNQRILELSPYAELEGMKKRLDKLMDWCKLVNLGNNRYHFSVSKGGVKLMINSKEERLSSSLSGDARELAKVVDEATKIGAELTELISGLDTMKETVEPLHEMLTREKGPETEKEKVPSQ